MNDWQLVETLLSESLADFLTGVLPSIGGPDWWQNYVLNSLTPPQVLAIQGCDEGDMQVFDFAALLRIADRNWMEIAIKQNLSKKIRTHIIELRDARNRYAHKNLKGIDPSDQLRDFDTALRVIRALKAKPALVQQVTELHQSILKKVATSFTTEEDEDQTNDPPSGQTPPTEEAIAGSPSTQDDDSEIATPAEVPAPKTNEKSSWIVDSETSNKAVQTAIAKQTFIGIDFGTSTTVVSLIEKNPAGAARARTLSIAQPDELGGTITHHLVNSVLAFKNNQLFFGKDAYRMRQDLFEGKNVFSSFKMRLGVDLGPIYAETAVTKEKCGTEIKDANDATREFFKLLRSGIDKALRTENLPDDLKIAVSVPASFEANQRRDLLENIKNAGLSDNEVCLIDEPNAAFLSYIHECAEEKSTSTFLKKLAYQRVNLLVYDFGAGTCDVSILEVGIDKSGLRSSNRAISRFTALGGDDLDRAIAEQVLLPQLLRSAPDFEPEKRDVEERLIPRLQPVAERLKIACIAWLTRRGIDRIDEIRPHADEVFTDHALPLFKIRNTALSLEKPQMTLLQFADALRPFVSTFDPDTTTKHVYAPVLNAIEKSNLEPEDLHAVLFIGGSAANPIVRRCVMNHLPASVSAIVPRDLQSHVSLGAAIHSLGFHSFQMDLIKPITSEPIFVITRGKGLQTIIPASTEVPTVVPFQITLLIDRSNQTKVELPICVGSESKLLGILSITSKNSEGFSVGEKVLVTANITQEKLLGVEASINKQKVATVILNPLANNELSPAETKMLAAKQKFNEALLRSKGRPSVEVINAYAAAALDAEAYAIAAEMFAAAERTDPTQNHATNICYAYSKAGKDAKSREWAKRAHDRDPDATTAYNLHCDAPKEERERLLRESLSYDPKYSPSLIALGRLLNARNVGEGESLLNKAVSVLSAKLKQHVISKSECKTLFNLATELGNDVTAELAGAKLESFGDDNPYDENNLASANNNLNLISRG